MDTGLIIPSRGVFELRRISDPRTQLSGEFVRGPPKIRRRKNALRGGTVRLRPNDYDISTNTLRFIIDFVPYDDVQPFLHVFRG